MNPSTIISLIRKNFHKRLQRKTNLSRTEALLEFELAIADTLTQLLDKASGDKEKGE